MRSTGSRTRSAGQRASTMPARRSRSTPCSRRPARTARPCCFTRRSRRGDALPRLATALRRVSRRRGGPLAVGRRHGRPAARPRLRRVASWISTTSSRRSSVKRGHRRAGLHPARARGPGWSASSCFYRDEPYEWSEREVRLAGTIANHLASATIRTTQPGPRCARSRELLETIMDTVDEESSCNPPTAESSTQTTAPPEVVGFDSAAAFIAADRQEVLDRFELLDEDGNALPADELPGRRALTRRVVGARRAVPDPRHGRGAAGRSSVRNPSTATTAASSLRSASSTTSREHEPRPNAFASSPAQANSC